MQIFEEPGPSCSIPYRTPICKANVTYFSATNHKLGVNINRIYVLVEFLVAGYIVNKRRGKASFDLSHLFAQFESFEEMRVAGFSGVRVGPRVQHPERHVRRENGIVQRGAQNVAKAAPSQI